MLTTADRIIPKVYDSDRIYAECELLKQELEALPEYTNRAKEQRVNLIRRQCDYLRTHLQELATMENQTRVAQIANENERFDLAETILANAKTRLAIREARRITFEGHVRGGLR